MIAAVCQPLAASPPNSCLRGLVIEMKRLWIKLRREGNHLFFVEAMRIADKALPHVQVVGVIPARVHHDFSAFWIASR